MVDKGFYVVREIDVQCLASGLDTSGSGADSQRFFRKAGAIVHEPVAMRKFRRAFFSASCAGGGRRPLLQQGQTLRPSHKTRLIRMSGNSSNTSGLHQVRTGSFTRQTFAGSSGKLLTMRVSSMSSGSLAASGSPQPLRFTGER
jgi:hypothetical protein